MNEPTLNIERLEYGYLQPLYQPLNFTCQRGEVIAILGANGAGKTTLLHTLLGIQPAIRGQIVRHSSLGFVPQIFTPPDYQVIDIVLMGRAQNIGLLNMPSKHDEQIALAALTTLKIDHLAGRDFNSLSGGQRQLVLIARALAMQCQTLILDEPTSALDIHNQNEVLKLIRQLADQQNISVIFSTHDPLHALLVADRTLLLMPEQRWLYGDSHQVLSENNLLATYGVVFKSVEVAKQQILVPLFDITQETSL
ncbi:MAG: ABC transporter ATP-binding protein [Enterobacteriaceae bacterium]|jgi:iron complex transport system ATP-binding protein|nr:ABC transporter ATP-binding protein [Enterobacteriaceae bacterium]